MVSMAPRKKAIKRNWTADKMQKITWNAKLANQKLLGYQIFKSHWTFLNSHRTQTIAPFSIGVNIDVKDRSTLLIDCECKAFQVKISTKGNTFEGKFPIKRRPI